MKAARFVTCNYSQISSVTDMLDSLDRPPFQCRWSKLKMVLFNHIMNYEIDLAILHNISPTETKHKYKNGSV